MQALPNDRLDQFRHETRAWLKQNCPPQMREPVVNESDLYWGGRRAQFTSEPQREWFDRMAQRGWTVPEWPTAYGGGGLSRDEAHVLREEMARLKCRSPLISFGISMLGPALLRYGSDAQKLEHLPKIATFRALQALDTAATDAERYVLLAKAKAGGGGTAGHQRSGPDAWRDRHDG